MSRKTVQVAVSIQFKTNLERLFPNTKGIRLKTEKLNELLEELLYGKKTK